MALGLVFQEAILDYYISLIVQQVKKLGLGRLTFE